MNVQMKKIAELTRALADLMSDELTIVRQNGEQQVMNRLWLGQQKVLHGLFFAFNQAADVQEHTTLRKLKEDAAKGSTGTGEIGERNRQYWIGRLQEANDILSYYQALAEQAGALEKEITGRDPWPFTPKGNVAPARQAGRDVELTASQKQLIALGVKIDIATDHNSEGDSDQPMDTQREVIRSETKPTPQREAKMADAPGTVMAAALHEAAKNKIRAANTKANREALAKG